MKNKTKTVLFVSLIAATVISFSGMLISGAVPNENANQIAKERSDRSLREDPTPMMVHEIDDKTKKEKHSISEERKNRPTPPSPALGSGHERFGTLLDEDVDNRLDNSKRELAANKTKILTNELMRNAQELGDKAAHQKLPISEIGYDYVENALKISIHPNAFSDKNIKVFEKTIRKLVGDEIDITFTKGQLVQLQSCGDRNTTECQPIKGGVMFDVFVGH